MRTLIILTFIVLFSQLAIGQKTIMIADKQIKKTKRINEPLEKVWWRWTTHEGLKTFFGVDNKIELRSGGDFEIYFLMNNPVGLRGSEGCKVMSYFPYQMFSFSWNAPPQYKELRESGYKTRVIVTFKKISDKQTEITLTHLDWPDDEKWTAVFDYYNTAWDAILDNLSKK